MKINIKSLLTGTTLVVASASNIDAAPPKGMKLIPNETVTHPVFGEMKVISHKEDLDFYHQKVNSGKDPFEDKSSEAELLAENFIKYVLDADSLKQADIPQEDIVKFVDECCYSQAGMVALKVIVANYMREYDRIKQFCKEHQAELKTCYDFSQTKEGKEFYEKERQIFELEEKLKNLLWGAPSERLEGLFGISSDDLKNLYQCFRREEEVFNNELKEFWIQLRKEDSEGFFIGEGQKYDRFCELYKHFLGKNDNKNNNDSNDDRDNLRIGSYAIKRDSERYKKLQNFVFNHKAGFERFFKIGDLRLAQKTLVRGSFDEGRCRYYYSKYKGDLERLSQLTQEEGSY